MTATVTVTAPTMETATETVTVPMMREARVMSEGSVVYPGTFDPVTFGHLDIIGRACRLFPRVVVAISGDISGGKESLFSAEERLGLLRASLGEVGLEEGDGLEVVIFRGLLTEFCRGRGIRMALRGMRAASDFEYEFQMAWTNARLNREMETVFLVASEAGHFISSRLAREVARYGGSLENFVPGVVAEALQARYK
ncbi:MAG: pantetheine-phosphate adenylyltransferase [Alphaproteobacteria bacterium]|nr:pantetheine-phosphate adenylyltransferase [Alphaproteobacteria bacterium]